MAARPPFSASPVYRICRQLVAALALAPLLAFGQPAIKADLASTREMVRFVPDEALRRLRGIEPEARKAPMALQAEFLLLYSEATRRSGDPQGALALADELTALGEAQQDNAALAKGQLARSYALSKLADPARAHVAAFDAERRALATPDIPLRVVTTITAGQAFQEQGNYPAALAKMQAAVDLARTVAGDDVTLSTALNGFVLLLTDMRQYDKGWALQAESLAVAKRMPSPGRLAIALSTEYGLAIDSGQNKRAREALIETLAVVRQLGAPQMEAATLVNLADIHLKERDYPRAAQYAQQAVAIATAVNSQENIAMARVNLGQAYLSMGRVAEGRRQVEAGLVHFEKAGLPQLQVLLAEYGAALERAGDYQGAVAAYHRERGISNELFAAQRQKAVLELQQKYDTETKQRQIVALRQDNRVQSAELDNRRLQQRIWWLLAVVFALAALVVGLLYRKVRQANAKLEVKNLELKQQSTLDPLTLLYNRRHFQDFMRGHGQVERRQPYDKSDDDIVGALFLLDVDHFKHINDSHGHAAGDAVLKMIAESLRVALRETDMIVRWGGEEFLAFLPTVPRNGLDDVARRILHGISSQAIVHGGKTLQVNVSVGFAPYPLAPGGKPLSWERAVNLVDMALYMAKSHGRNRAYGVRGFANLERTSLEAIEQDLEGAWRNGFVELVVVPGDTAETADRTDMAELNGR